jgi:hypothetical protein
MSIPDPTPAGTPAGTADPGTPDPGRGNGAGVAALVLGIVAVVAAANGWWLFLLPVALATGILAVVFGVKGRRAAAAGRAGNPGQSLAGLVLGTTALSLVALGGVAWAVWGDEWKDDDTFDECIDDADDAEELGVCLDRFPDDAEQLLG